MPHGPFPTRVNAPAGEEDNSLYAIDADHINVLGEALEDTYTTAEADARYADKSRVDPGADLDDEEVIVGVTGSTPTKRHGVTTPATPSKHYVLIRSDDDWEARLGPHINVLDYDVDPTGNNDSATGINQALQDSGGGSGTVLSTNANGEVGMGTIPVVLGRPEQNAVFSIADTLVVPEGGILYGTGSKGGSSELQFVDSDLTAHGISAGSDGAEVSDVTIANVRLVNAQTDPGDTRTGAGIHVNRVRNYIRVEDCLVKGFYDNYYIGSTNAAGVVDRGRMSRCWTVNPLRYGIQIQRLSNTFNVDMIWGDTTTSGDAIFYVISGRGSSILTLRNISHENFVGADTVVIESNMTVQVDSVAMSYTDTHTGGDVVKLAAGRGENVTLTNITGTNTAFGDSTTGPTNLLNVVAESFTIPASERSINHWVGYGSSTQGYPGATWVGEAKIVYVQATPEGLVPANPGSLAMRSDGSIYRKASGTGNTGWVALT